MRWSLCLLAVCASGLAAAELSEKFAKRLESADTAYQSAVQKADNVRFYAVQKASQERLKVLRTALADATKAGDFDAATAIKALVSEAESSGGVRPKPKNIMKFGTHEYAVIDDKVTWHTAKRLCEEMGGHLVTFESDAEQGFCFQACRVAKAAAWIGVSNEASVKQFKWVNGADATVDKSWEFNNGNSEDFSIAICYWPASGTFNDHNLGAHIGYVCEWDN